MNSQIGRNEEQVNPLRPRVKVVIDEYYRVGGDLPRFKAVLNRILLSQAQKDEPMVRIQGGKIRRSAEPVPGVLVLGDGWDSDTIEHFTRECVGPKVEEFAVTGSVEFDYTVSGPDGDFTYRGKVELNGSQSGPACDFTFLPAEVRT